METEMTAYLSTAPINHRRVTDKLACHARLMVKYEAQGLSREEASAKAYADMKRPKK